MSIVALVLNAHWLVQLVMIALLLLSIASWAVIIDKQSAMKRARQAADAFEARFWSGVELSTLYRDIVRTGASSHGLPAIFAAGLREFRLLRQSESGARRAIKASRRTMKVSRSREIDRLELNLPFLATVSNTSPFIGLFGTVWGIMNSFQALANVQGTTISTVAPGIADALIATAMGLLTAIPASFFFNRYVGQLSQLESRYESFAEELLAILERNAAGVESIRRDDGAVDAFALGAES